MFVSNDTKLLSLLKSASIPFLMSDVEPGQSVLIITDSDMDPNIWQAVAAAANSFGLETTVMVMADPREHHSVPPPKNIMEAMRIADISVSVTSKEFHSGGFFRAATEAGHAFLAIEGCNAEILTGPAARLETYKKMKEVSPILKEFFDNAGGTWHITSEFGTDFTCECNYGTGKEASYANLNWGGLSVLPDGECGIHVPIPGTGEGKIVIDTSIHYPTGLLENPITWVIEKGKLAEIQGGLEAQQLMDWMKNSCDAPLTSYDWLELSIGWNPTCPITGVLRTDKKHYGKLHTAIQANGKHPSTGANVRMHIDGVIHEPTITVNDGVVVDKGVIKIPPLDTWAEGHL